MSAPRAAPPARQGHPARRRVGRPRVLATFDALPRDVGERLRFMGQVPLAVRRSPATTSPARTSSSCGTDHRPARPAAGRTWLSLARATLAFPRGNDFDAAAEGHLRDRAGGRRRRCARSRKAERLQLGQAMIEARGAPAHEPRRARSRRRAPRRRGRWRCRLPARALRLSQARASARYQAGAVAHGNLAAHEALRDGDDVHPFARSRRANGIAYGRYRLGDRDGALLAARRAAMFAGDAGHVRLRAMALLMIARAGDDSAEADAARGRARARSRPRSPMPDCSRAASLRDRDRSRYGRIARAAVS